MQDDTIVPPVTTDEPVEETVETPAEESVEDKAARLEEANRKLFERAKKAEAEAKALKQSKPLQDKPKPVEETFVNDIKELKLAEKKRQFGYKNALSPEETDKLFRYAGDSDPNEVLKDPFFQAGLKTFRQQQKVQDATPSSSNRSTKVDGKTFAEMTAEERAKNWGKVVGGK